jgi:probable phosphoglycerate mutase
MANAIQLWLIRHGQTEANARHEFSGWMDVALTAQGQDEARALRPRLAAESFDGVWSSDLQRAVHTARLAHSEPRQDPRLREMHFGTLEGCTWDRADEALREALQHFQRFDAPGGETAAVFHARLHEFLDELPSGRQLIFAHGGVIRALIGPLGHDQFLQTGEIAVVDWNAQKVLQILEKPKGP